MTEQALYSISATPSGLTQPHQPAVPMMAIAQDQYYIDGDVLDVLEACDRLVIGLGRLQRQRRLSEEHWTLSSQHLDQIRVLVEACLVPGTRGATPRPDTTHPPTRPGARRDPPGTARSQARTDDGWTAHDGPVRGPAIERSDP
jgi:hypothetical protein